MALLALRWFTIVAAGALIALMLYAGEPTKLWWWLLAIPFGAWIIGPAIVSYLFANRFKDISWLTYLMLAFLALSGAWSASVYYEAFFVSTSSTSALVMIFVPLYEWAELACLALLSGTAIRRINRRQLRE